MLTIDPNHTGFHTAFMRHVGLGRRFSVADVAEMTGKSVSLVQKWLEGCRVPCANTFLFLCQRFGPAFTNHALGSVNQGGVMELVTDPVCPREAMAASASATSFMATAQADGVIDANEQMQIADMHDRAARLARNVRMGRCG